MVIHGIDFAVDKNDNVSSFLSSTIYNLNRANLKLSEAADDNIRLDAFCDLYEELQGLSGFSKLQASAEEIRLYAELCRDTFTSVSEFATKKIPYLHVTNNSVIRRYENLTNSTFIR